MKGARNVIGLLVGLLLAAPAWAEDDKEDPSNVDDQERITGKVPPPLPETPQSAHKDYEEPDEGDRPYPNSAYRGAAALQLDPQYVFEIQQGLEMMFLRDYEGSREHFTKVDKAFPDTAISSVADVLVWQALMLENFDFRFDDQYWVSSKAARQGLEAALKNPGNEGWEHFLMAGVVGIEAIHTMRQTKFLSALQMAFSAMDHIQKTRELVPDYIDVQLADGMYNYWRTVVTLSSKVLPDFGDHRVQGLEQMKDVERSGIFLSSPSTLSLAFSWLEEGKLREASAACQRNRSKYPKNIINNLVTGTTFVYQRRYSSAIGAFDAILAEDAENKRVRYWRGVALLRNGQLEEAEAEFKKYIAFDYMEDYQRSNAHYRLGQVYYRQKKFSASYTSYKEAVRLTKHKGAKQALERMKQRKSQGKIDY